MSHKIDWEKVNKEAEKNKEKAEIEAKYINLIVKYILWVCLALILLAGIGGSAYIYSALSPVDKKNEATIEITIPIGSSNRDISQILADHHLIKNETIFNSLLKIKNIFDLQAGHYQLSQAMDANAIIERLESGGRPISAEVDTKITIVEGSQLEEIAEEIGKHTDFSTEQVMKLLNNRQFISKMQTAFPSLLGELDQYPDLKYPLEGYLFPATYDYSEGDSLEDLIKQMIAQTNLEYQKLLDNMQDTYLSFHQVLTLASIIEKEGITDKDRALISGVFFNRVEAGMPLQSDITVLYAIGEHKELVTYKDLEVDSPYNLYIYQGFGPGPYNSPSLSAIKAAIYPERTNYYYFVADIDTQKVYYAENFEEHESLVEKYVNNRFESEKKSESQEDETEETDEVIDLKDEES